MSLIDRDDEFNQLLEDKRHKELLNSLPDEIDNEFQKLLEDKRHKEITLVLKEILLALTKNNTYDLSNIENILTKLVEQSNADLPKSILTMGKIISEKLDNLKIKEADYNWEFTIHRDHKDLITKVDATKIPI